MKFGIASLALAAIVLTACGPFAPAYPPSAYPNGGPRTRQFSSNGEQVFFTATGQSGQRMSYTAARVLGA